MKNFLHTTVIFFNIFPTFDSIRFCCRTFLLFLNANRMANSFRNCGGNGKNSMDLIVFTSFIILSMQQFVNVLGMD
jgi:hypothetical protein